MQQSATKTHDFRRHAHDQCNYIATSIATALNWSGNAMIGGGGRGSPWHRLSAQRWADGINLCPNAVLAFNHPSGEKTVCLGF